MNPDLQKQADALQKRIRNADREKLSEELKKQINIRFTELFEVVKTLNSYQYTRPEKIAEKIWQEGSTSLYNYKGEGQTILFIPPLINRSYILDLSENRSFIKYLTTKGFNCYLVDWDEPQNGELDFSLDDYIERIDKTIAQLSEKHGKITIAGYCMGGLMSLKSALKNQGNLNGIALFATPWDFHVQEFSRLKLDEKTVTAFSAIIEESEKISASIIQAAFYYLHASNVEGKFESMFQSIKENADGIEEFIELEHWANDGISMTRKVARECFIDWVHYNKIANSNLIDAAKIELPVFMLSGSKDNIVPKSSSDALASILPNVACHTINGGHISMVAGANPKSNGWEEFERWIKTLNTSK